jgi:hypothetical protein
MRGKMVVIYLGEFEKSIFTELRVAEFENELFRRSHVTIVVVGSRRRLRGRSSSERRRRRMIFSFSTECRVHGNGTRLG